MVVPVSTENGASGPNGPIAVAPAATPIVSGEGGENGDWEGLERRWAPGFLVKPTGSEARNPEQQTSRASRKSD